eukprot:5745867-Pyramimonas_sp.AAC.1
MGAAGRLCQTFAVSLLLLLLLLLVLVILLCPLPPPPPPCGLFGELVLRGLSRPCDPQLAPKKRLTFLDRFERGLRRKSNI